MTTSSFKKELFRVGVMFKNVLKSQFLSVKFYISVILVLLPTISTFISLSDSVEIIQSYSEMDKDLVIFADASIEENVENFIMTEVEPKGKAEFTMHSVSPAFVLQLCNKLYNVNPKTYLLHIKGYEWELKEGLTEKAKDNLKKAFDFLKEFIMNEI